MYEYSPPIEDTIFLLKEVLEIDRYTDTDGFGGLSTDLASSILSTSGRFSEEVIAPLNSSGDKEGCLWRDDGSVKTPTGFKEAYRQYCELGFPGVQHASKYGGQDLPATFTPPYDVKAA